jgi:hypothetical protein
MLTYVPSYGQPNLATEFFGRDITERGTGDWSQNRDESGTFASFDLPSQPRGTNGDTTAGVDSFALANARDSTDPSVTSLPTALVHLMGALLKTQDPHSAKTIARILETLPRSEELYIVAIRTALALDAPLVARHLAEVAHEYYSDDPEIGKMHHILQPPRIVKPTGRPIDVRANWTWILANRLMYSGRWVALQDGRLLADAEAADELAEQVGPVKGTGILITRVS